MTEKKTKEGSSPLLEGKTRAERGTHACNRLRQEGFIPAVAYGGKAGTLAVSLRREQLDQVLRTHERIIQFTCDGEKAESVMIKEAQWDPFGDEVVHVDLERIDLTKPVEVEVEVKIVGQAQGQSLGGQVEVAAHTLTVRCLPMAIPDAIRVDVTPMQIGDNLRVKDLEPLEGVTILNPPELTIVMVTEPQVEEEAAPAPVEETGAVEPEVIRRAKEEEGEEEEEK